MFLRLLLGVRGRRQPDGSFLELVDTDYVPETGSTRRAEKIISFLPNLKWITIQPQMIAKGPTRLYRAYHDVLLALQEIVEVLAARNDTNTEARHLHLLPARAMEKRYPLTQALAHWLDVVDGGDGPWPHESSPISSLSTPPTWAEARQALLCDSPWV